MRISTHAFQDWCFHTLHCNILVLYRFSFFSLYSVDLDSLGPLLGQIIVALSPLVEGYVDSVAEIFEFLIVEHRCVHVYCT